MEATIPPGWHSDPGDPSSLRWWDGTQWTEHRCPAPVAAPGSFPPGVVAPANGSAPPGFSEQPGGYAGQPPAGYAGQPPAGQLQAGYAVQPQPPPVVTKGPPGYTGYQSLGQGARNRGRGARARGPNSFSWTAIGFAAAYLVLALTTNFVLLGIVPVLSSFRAFQRGEKLAPLAAVAAAVTVCTAVYFIGFHHH